MAGTMCKWLWTSISVSSSECELDHSHTRPAGVRIAGWDRDKPPACDVTQQHHHSAQPDSC